MDNYSAKFGNGLRLLRNNKGYTVDKLAGLSGVDSSDITHVENNINNFSFDNMIDVLNGLQAKFNDCMNVQNDKDVEIYNIKEKLMNNTFTDDEIEFFNFVINSYSFLRGKNG